MLYSFALDSRPSAWSIVVNYVNDVQLYLLINCNDKNQHPYNLQNYLALVM